MAIANKEFVINKLNELTTFAKKKYGQNFLIDDGVASKIVDSLNIKDNETVIEIGPGLGALTFNLVKYKDNKIIAYDIDEIMVDHLNKYFSYETNFKCLNQDFLKVNLKEEIKDSKVSFIGNLPYYITSDILEKILTSGLNLDTCVFMIQKEAYARINAKKDTKEYGPLAILIEYVGKVSRVMDVNKDKFYPAPHIDSMVFKIECNKEIDKDNIKKFYSFINKCFLMRRKTILNNLTQIMSKDDAIKVLEKSHIDSLTRPENISLNEYINLFSNI